MANKLIKKVNTIALIFPSVLALSSCDFFNPFPYDPNLRTEYYFIYDKFQINHIIDYTDPRGGGNSSTNVLIGFLAPHENQNIKESGGLICDISYGLRSEEYYNFSNTAFANEEGLTPLSAVICFGQKISNRNPFDGNIDNLSLFKQNYLIVQELSVEEALDDKYLVDTYKEIAYQEYKIRVAERFFNTFHYNEEFLIPLDFIIANNFEFSFSFFEIYERDVIIEGQTKYYVDIESSYTISLEYYEIEDKIIFPTPFEESQRFVVEDL